MPAYEENVKGAEAEGIKFQFLASPTKVLSEGEKIASLGCIRTQLGEADVSGRKRPIPIQGSDFFVEVDTVILAIGQASDLSFLQGTKIRTAIEGTIQVDSISLQTSKIGTFSGGDIVTGAASVIEAISAGRRAASSIDKYLGGKGELSEGIVSEEKVSPPMQGFPVGKRNEGRLLPVEDRLKGFALVDTGFSSEEEAISEAKRCLRCDLPIIVDTSKCTSCLTCSLYCSFVVQGIFNPMKAQVRVRTSLEEANSISFTDDCDNCGICARYCPYGALAR
jgi:ferredoxin